MIIILMRLQCAATEGVQGSVRGDAAKHLKEFMLGSLTLRSQRELTMLLVL
jgi:hypothetical protein